MSYKEGYVLDNPFKEQEESWTKYISSNFLNGFDLSKYPFLDLQKEALLYQVAQQDRKKKVWQDITKYLTVLQQTTGINYEQSK